MRIQIKVFVDADSDKDCSGQKPDFWVSARGIDEAVECLYDLAKPVAQKLEGIKTE